MAEAHEPQPEVQIELEITPVSLQGSATAKAAVQAQLRATCRELEQRYWGEVEINVLWRLHEQRRWDTPGVLSTPDIDNILKPLIDGLSGPDGVLVDDCQVQTVTCSWIDWPDLDSQHVTVRIRPLSPNEVIERDIEGVQCADGLCWIVPQAMFGGNGAALVRTFEELRGIYEELLGRGVAWEQARLVLPVMRRFHRSQLDRHGFLIRSVNAYLEAADQSGAAAANDGDGA